MCYRRQITAQRFRRGRTEIGSGYPVIKKFSGSQQDTTLQRENKEKLKYCRTQDGSWSHMPSERPITNQEINNI